MKRRKGKGSVIIIADKTPEGFAQSSKGSISRLKKKKDK